MHRKKEICRKRVQDKGDEEEDKSNRRKAETGIDVGKFYSIMDIDNEYSSTEL